MYPRLEPLLIFLPFHVPAVSIHRRRAKTRQTCLDPSRRRRWVIKWSCVERRWSLQEIKALLKPYKKKKASVERKKKIYNKKLTCHVSSLYPSPGPLPTLSSPRVPVQTRIWIVQTTDNFDVRWFLQCQSRNLHKTEIMITETVPKSRRHKGIWWFGISNLLIDSRRKKKLCHIVPANGTTRAFGNSDNVGLDRANFFLPDPSRRDSPSPWSKWENTVVRGRGRTQNSGSRR